MTLKRFLPKTLLGRSLLIIVTPLILVQVISTWVFYDRHWETVTQRLAWALAGDIALVANLLRRYPDPQERTWILETAHSNLGVYFELRFNDVLPNAPARGVGGMIGRTMKVAMNQTMARPFLLDMSDDGTTITVDVQVPEGVLHAVTSRKRLFSATTYLFVMWSVGSSLVLFAVATVFMRNQVRPIRRLADAADSFGKGRDVPGFKPSGAAEVRQAARAFIIMRERIKRQMSQRTEMLAGISHDLRTPLTRAKLQLAMLDESPELNELRSDIEEMEKMVDEFLAFARGEGREAPVESDLSGLLTEVVQGLRANGSEIDLRTKGNLRVQVRPTAFRRCLTNVINNAQRYGTSVAVGATRRGTTVEIVIDDDGPGIPAAQREEVFKPFGRLDRSRNIDTGGVGLGLTIARDIMRGHGGDILLEDSPRGGLRAKLLFPT